MRKVKSISSNHMKVILEDAERKVYLGQRGSWTRDAREALDFGAVPVAVDCALVMGLKHVRPVLKSKSSNWELKLPKVLRH